MLELVETVLSLRRGVRPALDSDEGDAVRGLREDARVRVLRAAAALK